MTTTTTATVITREIMTTVMTTVTTMAMTTTEIAMIDTPTGRHGRQNVKDEVFFLCKTALFHVLGSVKRELFTRESIYRPTETASESKMEKTMYKENYKKQHQSNGQKNKSNINYRDI